MLGYIMWDYESDAPFMWPEKQQYPTHDEMRKILDRNPEEASIRGKWADLEFLKERLDAQPDAQGHPVRRLPRPRLELPRGLQARPQGQPARQGRASKVSDDDPKKFEEGGAPVEHPPVDVGMHCVDCHFAQDMHGNGHHRRRGRRRGRDPVPDCHGTAGLSDPAHSGPMASKRADLSLMRNPDGQKRFEWINGKLIQRSAMSPGPEWEMSLVKDTGNAHVTRLQRQGRRAHTMLEGHQASLRRRPAAKDTRARRGQDAVLHLPHLVDHQLRRLPPADPGQLEDRAPPLRRRRDTATTPPTTRRWRATTCSSWASTARSRITRSRRCARPRR
jgi:hypothetical protein